MAVGGSIGGAGFNQGYSQTLEAEVGQAPGYQDPYLVQALGGMPVWYQAMGATAFRGSNTILTGGWADRRAGRKKFFRGNPWDPGTGTVRGAIRNNNLLFPRTWSRYASQGLFFEDKYSPMGMAAGAINWAGRTGKLGTRIEGMAAGGDLVRGGILSQIVAAERVGRPGNLPGRQSKWFGNYLDKAVNAGGILKGFTPDDLTDPQMRRRLAYMSMQGKGGQWIGGYMASMKDMDMPVRAGTSFARGHGAGAGALRGIGITADQAAGKVTMKEGISAIRGALKTPGGKAVATKGAAALGIRAVGNVAPVVAPLFWLWTAYDIAKAVIPRAPEFAAEVYTSYTGWGNRRMFGAPFKTNEAAITSRQRGVMAIQNSRMNARNVIGSEASGVAAYFG